MPPPPSPASPPRVAIVVVPGVGDQPEGEAVEQMATGLTRLPGDGWRWCPDPGRLPVDVPAAGARRAERYDAPRRRLRGPDGADVDLVEMRWSDLSSFPGGTVAGFVGSAFGLGVQLATVGLEGTDVGRSRSGRLAWPVAWGFTAVVAVGLTIVGLSRGSLPPWTVLVGALLCAAALLGTLGWVMGSLRGFANRTMEVTSWWVAALVIPLTVIAALTGTALWLAVDEPLGIPDPLALVLVALASVPAMAALGRGLGRGGWSRPGGGTFAWATRLITPSTISFVLLGLAALVTGWRIAVTGTIEAGLGQTVLVVGGYAVRPAWLGALVLVAATLIVLSVVHLRDPARDVRATFTRVATTVLSPLLVAIVGTLLVGGIGAVAFQSADDATWGSNAGEVRCLTDASDWAWSRICGDAGAQWPATAVEIERLDAASAAASHAASEAREAVARDGARPATFGMEAAEEARALGDQAAALERSAGVNPTAWATEVFGLAMLPLVPVFGVLVLGALFAGLFLMSRHETGSRPGALLDDALASLTGKVVSAALVVGGVAAAVVAVGVWILGWASDPVGSAQGWALLSVVAIALTLLARVMPIDPRTWRGAPGGALASARKGIDIPYDVATYLRVDTDQAGVRSQVVARYRALLGALQEEHDHVVIAAHSQGTMYSLATLAGDLHRSLPEHSDGWGVAPWHLAVPGSRLEEIGVSLLTFGCPVRQTYEARLPGQYDWTDAAAEGLPERLRMLSGPWVNAYRPRDYIGRPVFHSAGTAGALTARTVLAHEVAVPDRDGPVPVVDACIPGTGSHSGYFGDRHLLAWLDALVRRALHPGAPGWMPPGYSPPDAAAG